MFKTTLTGEAYFYFVSDLIRTYYGESFSTSFDDKVQKALSDINDIQWFASSKEDLLEGCIGPIDAAGICGFTVCLIKFSAEEMINNINKPFTFGVNNIVMFIDYEYNTDTNQYQEVCYKKEE